MPPPMMITRLAAAVRGSRPAAGVTRSAAGERGFLELRRNLRGLHGIVDFDPRPPSILLVVARVQRPQSGAIMFLATTDRRSSAAARTSWL